MGQWNTDESRDVGFVWTGLTLFQTSGIPDFIVEQETHDKAARDAKALPRPNEPTDQQRATHNLTPLPYRSWCEYCVKSKGRENHFYHLFTVWQAWVNKFHIGIGVV